MISEHISEMTRWNIVIKKEEFDALKTKECFWALVALGRAVNALRFVQMPLINHENDDSPAAMRARYNSLLFSSALFVESFLLVQRLNKHFWQMAEFQQLSSVTNKSKEAQDLINAGLFDLRNKLVFHFEIDEIGKQLALLKLSEPIFVSAMGQTNGQVYYELPDLCALSTFSGSLLRDDDTYLEAMKNRMKAVSDLITDFATEAEKLIVTVLTNEGWQGVVLGS